MQDIETTKLKAKRRTDWKRFRRLGLQIGLSTAESFLKGAAVAGGAAVMTKRGTNSISSSDITV